ncbi:signal recognition particle 14kD protein-domain-containing protein [Sphaerosporella brunnea]|uniref:Signal recognition particle subunit SRP14 n=1 Tax=Sphaerosporella brunnea TaxID=1250544 RepID=A0A5J5F4P6_9PEZI|nr:signal recognition particle 14kD protein-domain-containing protein [Sphaerosporella brunnea]
MVQERLSNDEFFTKLTSLLSAATAAQKNSVYLTQKPLTPLAPPSVDSPRQLLIRATNGSSESAKKIKLATVVDADELDRFFAKYAEVCKANMGSLKKRDRKKRKERMRKKGAAAATATATPTA